MRRTRFNLLLFCILASIGSVYAKSTQNIIKEIVKTFDVKPGVLVSVENRYGHIHVDTWEKDQVKIEALIKVKTSSKKLAEEVLKFINIGIEGDEYNVSAITEIIDAEKALGWWDKIFKSGSSCSNIDYEIVYKIHTPYESSLDLSNKYGHIYLNQPTKGNVTLLNKYGHIYGTDIDGNVSLALGYGNAKLGNMHNLVAELKYGKLTCQDGHNVKIETKYSHIDMGDVNTMDIISKYDEYDIKSVNTLHYQGKYDDFDIGNIGNLMASTKYSTIQINHIINELDFSGKYNSLNIASCDENLSKVDIEGKYTNILIKTDEDYTLDLNGENISHSLPREFEKIKYLDEDGQTIINGSKGKNGANIKADLRYGSFKIKD